jgi:tellurite resistance protein TerC
VRTGPDDEVERESRLISWVRKRVAITDTFDGAKLRTDIDG